jgi:hypothetical protein
MDPEQSMKQKKIAFAQSDHIEAVVALLRESCRQEKLVGDTEYETVVNAVTLDAQSDLIIKFINQIDFIKQGGLHR